MTWVVGIPPDTGGTIIINTISIGKSICCRGIEDFAHEGKGIVENGGSLQLGQLGKTTHIVRHQNVRHCCPR
jgi:hypothetical protein